MRVYTRAAWLPREGNADSEYEDASWPLRPARRDLTEFRCAVADGATETSYSGLWARMLVRAYGRGALEGHRIARSLPRLRAAWRREVGGRPLPWYAEEKLRAGAFSTLLGLSLRALPGAETCRWEALAVGDSCLFHVRRGELLSAFPLKDTGSFDSSPYLLSSNHSANPDLCRHLHSVEGECAPGDDFYLLSDALACWFLRETEARKAPSAVLQRFDGPDMQTTFGEWLSALRREGRIRNDDVTMLHVTLE